MKHNYRAWEVDANDFYGLKKTKERLLFLLNFAVLAPSSHNSQPWSFKVTEEEIVISPNFERALPSSDKNHRQLYISLGCALENLIIAADYYGLNPAFDESRMAISFSKFDGIRDSDKEGRRDHLIFSISRRKTNRNKYMERVPDENFVSWARGLSVDGLIVSVIEKAPIKDEVADIVVEAIEAAMHDKEFRRELSIYLKSNFTKSCVGMPGFGFGAPGLPSLIVPYVMRKVDISKMQKYQDEKLLKKHTPMFFIISTEEDNEGAWVKAGRAYERIALKTEALGIETHPMAAAIQIGNFYKKLQEVLELDLRPQFFCRVGYCAKLSRHSPRIPALEVVAV